MEDLEDMRMEAMEKKKKGKRRISDDDWYTTLIIDSGPMCRHTRKSKNNYLICYWYYEDLKFSIILCLLSTPLHGGKAYFKKNIFTVLLYEYYFFELSTRSTFLGRFLKSRRPCKNMTAHLARNITKPLWYS